jgi:hypothetical protein
VKDTSGAVLPGVTIEASSPALITKARTGVSDESGQYRIPDLPPGTYKVTFTLAGFATVVREGVELSGGGVMTIGAEMKVGGLAESVTVTGESPVVDVQTARQQTVIDGDIVRGLPAARSYGNYIAAIPAIQATGFGGGAATINNFFSARGGRNTEGLIQLDGMNVGAPGNGGGVSGYLYDMGNSSEVQVAISGGLGEADRGGPAFNIIPKTGGNRFSGTGFTSYAGKWGQSSNIDDNLRSLNFGEQPALIKSYDANIAVGGPILRDRLWFYGNARMIGTYQEQQNLYDNLNAGNPNAWTWARSNAVSVRNATSKTLDAVRLTWQATQRNKFGFYIDYTKNCSAGAYKDGGNQCRGIGDGWIATGPGVTPGTATVSPESGTIWDAPAKIMQGSWTSPFSNHLLLETGYSAFYTDNGDPRPFGVLTDFIPVTEQSTGVGVPFANFIYRGFNPAPSSFQKHATWRAAMSYVSGSHNMKWGYQAGYMSNINTTYVGRQISYRFNNGSPNQMSQRVGTNETSNSLLYNGFYVQDQWTRKRLTLQGALRFESASSWAPAGENGIIADNEFGGPFLLPRTEGVHGYHDITPRMGATYDLFGSGKTALKVSVGQYLQGAWTGDAYTINNPGSTLLVGPERKSRGRLQLHESGRQRRVRCVVRPQLGLLQPDHHRQPGCPHGMGHAQSRLAIQLQRAAGNRTAGLDGSQLQPSRVEQFLRDAEPRAHRRGLRYGHADRARKSAPAQRRRLPGHVSHAQHAERPWRDGLVLHDRRRLRRRNALLARHRRPVQRADAEQPESSGRHKHGPWRERHLRRADLTLRGAHDSDDRRRRRHRHHWGSDQL